MTTTYKNPWHNANGTGSGPATYSTEAKPVQVGKYIRFYRIQSRNPSARCYDFVLNGICVAQRCGPADEATIDSTRRI